MGLVKTKLREWSKRNESLKRAVIWGKSWMRRRNRLNGWLVRSGEQSSVIKTLIVQVYSVVWWRYYRSLHEEAEKVLKLIVARENNIDRVTIKKTNVDILFCNFAYGFPPDEYLLFRLEELPPEKRREFVSDRDRWDYSYAVNDILDQHIFKDKFETACVFKEYFHREVVKIGSEGDYDKFKEFATRHKSFILKPLSMGGGKGVRRIDVTDDHDFAYLGELYIRIIGDGPCILEELIVQVEEMSSLHPCSVNSVRCQTLLTQSGEVEVLFAFLRIGRDNKVVDNAAVGSLVAGIDVTTGIVNTRGADIYARSYVRHPDTDVVIEGFQVPRWNELLELVDELARIIPTTKLLGWDLALTEVGWVLIEGNCPGQFYPIQMASLVGLKREVEDHIVRALPRKNEV